MISPICLFTYNRLEVTQKTVQALQKNYLASESHLILFSDGAKHSEDETKVKSVRDYLKTIQGFKKIEIIESETNKGLAQSVITGVTEVLSKYDTAIILEDDLVTTPNFLDFMNQGLAFYQDKKEIISICGYSLKIKKPAHYIEDNYFYGRSSSWGWATWRDRWDTIDWEVKDWDELKKNKTAIKKFNKNGSDLFSMLKSVKEGNGTSWAVRFCYHQSKENSYSVFPFYSLVNNIGFMKEATHTTSKYSRFKVNLDKGLKRDFCFKEEVTPNAQIEKQCYHYHSLYIRLYSRVRYFIGF